MDGGGLYITRLVDRSCNILLHQIGKVVTESTTKQKLATLPKSNTISILSVSPTSGITENATLVHFIKKPMYLKSLLCEIT